MTWPSDNPPSSRWPLYTRGNVGEVFPEVVNPLTWLLLGVEAERGWRLAYRDFGLLTRGDIDPDESMTILGVFGGYCYINASLVRLLGVRTPGLSVDDVDTQNFGESDAPAYVERAGDKNWRSSARIVRSAARTLTARSLPQLQEDKIAVRQLIAGAPTAEASDERILGFLHGYALMFRELFRHHLLITTQATVSSGLVADLCADKLDDPGLALTLMGGIGEVESAGPAAAMWKLSRMGEAEYDEALPGFLADFGSRGPNEWDLASPTWELRPELVHAAVDRMRGANAANDPSLKAHEMRQRREEATASARGRLGRADRLVFDRALASLALFSQGRERSKTTVIRSLHEARKAVILLTERARNKGGIESFADVCVLTPDEFEGYVQSPAEYVGTIEERAAERDRLNGLVPPFIVEGDPPSPDTWAARGAAIELVQQGDVLTGIGGCAGVSEGRARVVLDAGEPGDIGPGDVLVAPITDPSWTPLFTVVEGVVVDVGAVLSHAVIVSRELGIPCVVSVANATGAIPDGALIRVDGGAGTVEVLELPDDWVAFR
ncbi:MAG: hypothetical protein HKN26_07550 [Acidimicrobiales bacterium]|nr:hypothetical protein [Acidimicrobiales bacterium]